MDIVRPSYRGQTSGQVALLIPSKNHNRDHAFAILERNQGKRDVTDEIASMAATRCNWNGFNLCEAIEQSWRVEATPIAICESATDISPKPRHRIDNRDMMVRRKSENLTDAEFTEAVSKEVLANRHSAIGTVWRKLDNRAQTEIAAYVGYYVGRKSDRAVMDHRRKRGDLVKRALTKQISALRKAHRERVAFEEVGFPVLGKIVDWNNPADPTRVSL